MIVVTKHKSEAFGQSCVEESLPPYGNRRNVVADKSFSFALRIIELYKELKAMHEYELGRQLLRSGTSIGANISEAGAAQTKRDFITKMSIASKEARETHYWLRLLNASRFIDVELKEHLTECTELVNILTVIVKTAQANLKK